MTDEEFKQRLSLSFGERGFSIYFDGECVHKDVETVGRTKEYLDSLLHEKTGSILSFIRLSGTVTIA